MADTTTNYTTEPPLSAPRISFSADLSSSSSSSDSEGDNICVEKDKKISELKHKAGDFEFLSENTETTQTMLTADELFSEGKLLPFRQTNHSEKLKNITFKTTQHVEEEEEQEQEQSIVKKDGEALNNNNRGSWFFDDDPSPRPPNCTVLWKELLRLKKQRPTTTTTTTKKKKKKACSSSLSPSSSSSLIGDAMVKREEEKRGLERTRSLTVRIRPMIHVPHCTPSSSSSSKLNSSLPPLFPLRLNKNRVEK
ncbi:unnamed protein product [Cochlearia groenlandica]